jgi:methylmalonyl-CoA mutase N-terminal domain/subunit
MKKNYENLDSALNIESKFTEIESVKAEVELAPLRPTEKTDIEKDYEYTRANLYSLIEKGQEAINGIIEIANDGGSARAYEVAGQLIKSVGDVTDKLIDLQKKLKDIEEEKIKTTNNTMNNAIFVGSTTELSKFLKQGFLNNKE